ncbi:unnamed protein product [Strongylus vulgaris]|uniref:Uncharacterized protein n=1 Tax=Strongylus vulgaris TaxID=40348 RepID=A0A3P7IAK4_STRVU|nr:unnamed protein product [Strongylus vulgaris]
MVSKIRYFDIRLIFSLRITSSSVEEATKLPKEEVTKLLECLFANAMRFFVLYCVHALRDQAVVKISKTGSAFYHLKVTGSEAAPLIDYEVHALSPKIRFCISDENMNACMPLSEMYMPTFDDWRDGNDCASLLYQIAHLPAPQITRLLLGERLYALLQLNFPIFVAQMNEYAILIKRFQSKNRYRGYNFATSEK